jgi:5-methylcytosine-specific restriction endonuclease McrA
MPSESAKKANRKYYLLHRQEVLERSKVWHRLHPRDKAATRIKDREWRKNHPEYDKLHCNKYNATHREKRRLYGISYRAKNLEKVREGYRSYYSKHKTKRIAAVIQYAKSHPELSKRKRATRTHAPGYGYTNKKHVTARWEMFGNKCWICGKEATTTDHVKPIKKGGSHWPANLRPACAKCNASKSAKWEGLNTVTELKQGGLKCKLSAENFNKLKAS